MSTCSKVSYSSGGDALRALSILKRRGYPTLAGIHPCSECHAWHVTSKKPSGQTVRQMPGRLR